MSTDDGRRPVLLIFFAAFLFVLFFDCITVSVYNHFPFRSIYRLWAAKLKFELQFFQCWIKNNRHFFEIENFLIVNMCKNCAILLKVQGLS